MENKTQQNQQAQGAAAGNNTELQIKQKSISDSVLERVNVMEQEGNLVLPEGYHAGNALKLAWLYLQTVEDKDHHPALKVCTKDSIANCLLRMVVNGLYVDKHQCYFIVYGSELTFMEDYRGSYLRAKRDTEIKGVYPQVIYENDTFSYTVDELGQYQLTEHRTSLANINPDKIIGAYAIVVNKDGTRHMEVMTIAQIHKSWDMGQGYKNGSKSHKNFPDQMCKKTVLSRACKIALGSSPDDMEEKDPAAMQREAAQQAPRIIPAADAEFVEINEPKQLVDINTGEILTPSAPEPEKVPVRQNDAADDCPI